MNYLFVYYIFINYIIFNYIKFHKYICVLFRLIKFSFFYIYLFKCNLQGPFISSFYFKSRLNNFILMTPWAQNA